MFTNADKVVAVAVAVVAVDALMQKCGGLPSTFWPLIKKNLSTL